MEWGCPLSLCGEGTISAISGGIVVLSGAGVQFQDSQEALSSIMALIHGEGPGVVG